MKMSMQRKSENKTIKDGFEEFVRYKKANNLRDATIKDYKVIFDIFAKFCGEDTLCKSINEKIISEYICYLRTKPKKQNNMNNKKEQPLSDITIATYIRHLRAIINYWIKCGYTIPFTVIVPRADEEVKEPYTDEELTLLLKKPDLKKCSFSEYRNWVMTNYFLSTANRLETVRNILVKDIHFADNEIYLRHVKNRKPYTIPLQKDLKKILTEYLEYRHGEPDDYLFCSENDDKKPLSNESVKTAMSRYNEKRGVAKTSVHRYRNTFAKFWIINGGDLLRLKAILGHKTLTMVLRYVDMYGKDLQQNFDTYNPLSAFSVGQHLSLRK